MIGRFLVAVLLSLLLLTATAVIYYWFEYGAGENLFREYVVVYKQYARVRIVEVDGRSIEQRYYEVESQPPVRRWEVILPAIILNNGIIFVTLTVLAVWYSNRITGPVYRMKKEMSLVLQGQSGVRVHLRKRDEFRDLADMLNRLIDRVDNGETGSTPHSVDA